MKTSPIIIFTIVMALLIGGVISFIQGPQFARVIKTAIARYVPSDLGVTGDFTGLDVKLFPPGLSIRNPHLRLLDHNVANLPAGSSISAERIDLTFRPVQMLSGNIRVHEVTVVDGDIRLILGKVPGQKPKKKTAKTEYRWDELLQLHAESVLLRNTRVHVESDSPALTADLMADSLRVAQWKGKGGLGYELELELSQIQSSLFKSLSLPKGIDRLGATAHVNAAGLKIDSFELAATGSEASAHGLIKGNVLEGKNLVLDAELAAKGDLTRVIEIAFRGAKTRPEASGGVSFSGKIHALPDRFLETVNVQGRIRGQDIKYQQWKTDSLDAELGWQAAASGGEVSVSHILLSTHDQVRLAPDQAGSGGKIEVGAFKLNLADLKRTPMPEGKAAVVSVPITLDHVHLHWLAAPVLKNVFPLGLRASGPVTLEFHPATSDHPWFLGARLALDVNDLQLDNQHLGEIKPLHKVLQVQKVRVEGAALLDSTGVHLNGIQVNSGATVFKGGGKIDFKAGFDLLFDGQVDLADVGQIVENDIRGKGTVKVRVHGPASSVYVDFEPNVTDASYLRLQLGELQGRITWDDDKNRLLLSGVKALKGRTTYQGDGVIDVDKNKDTIDLNIRVAEGDIQDIIQVFDSLTQDLWWFPRELTGAVHGDVRISGGLSMDKLVVAAKLIGTDWQQWDERFSKVAVQGGLDRGKYQITDFSGVKRQGRVSARVSVDTEHVIDWGLHTEDFTVGDFDHVARLDVPLRGKLVIESAGKGKEGAIKSSTLVQLNDLAVRGAAMPSSQLTVNTEGGKAEVHGTALGGQGTLEALYDFAPNSKSSLKGELKQLDFSPVLLLINSRLIQERALAGNVSGAINLSFQSGLLERANGKVDITGYHLAKKGATFDLSHPVSFKVSDGSFEMNDLALKGLHGEATVALQSRKGELEGSVSGDVDVSLLEFLTSTVSDAEGTAGLDFAIGGVIKSPTIFGKSTFDGLSLRVNGLDAPFDNVSGTFQLRQNTISAQGIQGDLAGGRVTADGTVLLFSDRVPKIDLKANLSGNKLKIFPFQFVKVHGGLEVHGEKIPYLVDGSLIVDSALSREKVFNQKKGEGLKALQYTPPPSSSRSNDYPLFKLNIGVLAENGVLIQNDLFDVEAKGRLTIVNTIEAPRILGTAELISGKMVFKDRAFQIQSANAVFDNPTVINPSFSLAANTDVNGTKIQLYVSGHLGDMKIDLSSNPVMAESEILSLIALGYTSTDAKRMSATDRSAYEQGEAASLLLHSLDFNREVQNKTGLQIQLDESVSPQQQGTSIFKPTTGADSIAQPKIVIKRQIGKRFDLSYGTTVGGANATAQKEVNAEFHFTPGFSVLGVWDNYETIDTVERTSIGLDLKFQTRFK